MNNAAAPAPRLRQIAPRDVPALIARKGGLRLLVEGGEIVTVRGARLPADWDRAGALLVDGADGRSRLIPVTGKTRLTWAV
jgi:hypothetical protein